LQGRDPVEFLEAADVRSADLVITTSADSPRAFPARQLADIVQRFGVMTEVIEDIGTAVQRAIDVSTEGDVVVVAGSQYVVGPARHYLESHPHTEVV
jgi:folylpolyglutamate synthase/dihydropteroate synthase